METAIKLFFSSPRFAVAGASQDQKKFGYKVLAWYHAHGLNVQPVTPSRPAIKVASTNYSTVPSPSALPLPQETSLSIITPPAITLKILHEAKEAGIKAVWMQPGSFDDEGLEYAKKEFAAWIGGNGWCILEDGDEGLRALGDEREKEKESFVDLYQPIKNIFDPLLPCATPCAPPPASRPQTSPAPMIQLRDRRGDKCDVKTPEELSTRYIMALQIPLSGSLSLETTLPPKLDAGAKSHIFQPPRTPSASTSLHRSSAFLLSQHGKMPGSRKRSRKDSYLAEEPLSNTFDASAWSPMESYLHSSMTCPGSPDEMSPAPLINTQYKLAGGLDTPTAALSSTLERYDCYASLSDPAMRGPGRGWGRNSGIEGDNYFPQIAPTFLGKETNGRPRFQMASSQRQQHQQYQEYQESSGGSFAKTVFAVAGKVWEFCKASAFRGFYAGGGQGFNMLPPSHSEQTIWEGSSEPKDYNFSQMTPIPGRFPTEELRIIPDYMSRNYHHQLQETSPSRPAKKHQREKPGSRTELQASWVIVGPRDASSLSRESSPSKPSLRKYPPSRRPLKKPIHHRPRPSFSYAGSPSLSQPFASTTSPRASGISPSKIPTASANSSPVNIEVARHAARIRKREVEEEANLQRLNRQLKAMIKEGKEALGTKYEIEMGEDEGYAEGDEYLFEEGVVEKG